MMKNGLTLVALTVAALVLATPALAQSWTSAPGQTHWLRTGGITCHNREPLDVLTNRYLSTNQRIAALSEYEQSGDCVRLPPSTFVTVHQYFQGKVCVTVRGGDRCAWMWDPALDNAPRPY